MEYCNSKQCKMINTCKYHVVNLPNGNYEIVNCYEILCTDDNYLHYESIPCKKCGRNVVIWSMDMCKSCYYANKYRKPVVEQKKRGRKVGSKYKTSEFYEKYNLIKAYKNEGKTFEEIGKLLGVSRQRASYIFNSMKEE